MSGTTVEINRNHYLVARVVVLAGIQTTLPSTSYLLTKPTTRVLAAHGRQSSRPSGHHGQSMPRLTCAAQSAAPTDVWARALISLGRVLVLHAWRLKHPRPGSVRTRGGVSVPKRKPKS